MDKRAGEDPIATIISALEQLTASASKLDRRLMRAFYLLLVWLAFAFFLWASAVIKLTVFDIISYAILIIIVLLAMRYLVEIRENLSVVINRYGTYKFMQESDFAVPPGKDRVDRFKKYLDNTFEFTKLVKNRRGKILENVDINGVKFNMYAEIKKPVLGGLRGVKSYSFYLTQIPEPSVSDLKKVINAARADYTRKKLEPGRIVVIAEKLDDAAYEFLTSDSIDTPIQVVIEMDDKTYDFIPFIGPRPDRLP